jgi:hypothetical protein
MIYIINITLTKRRKKMKEFLIFFFVFVLVLSGCTEKEDGVDNLEDVGIVESEEELEEAKIMAEEWIKSNSKTYNERGGKITHKETKKNEEGYVVVFDIKTEIHGFGPMYDDELCLMKPVENEIRIGIEEGDVVSATIYETEEVAEDDKVFFQEIYDEMEEIPLIWYTPIVDFLGLTREEVVEGLPDSDPLFYPVDTKEEVATIIKYTEEGVLFRFDESEHVEEIGLVPGEKSAVFGFPITDEMKREDVVESFGEPNEILEEEECALGSVMYIYYIFDGYLVFYFDGDYPVPASIIPY